MIDELDLAFDEHAERSRPRHRRGIRRRGGDGGGGGGAGKSVIAFLMAFVLLGALGVGAWYGFDKVSGFFTVADYDGPGTGEAQVQVKTGQTATDIGNTLVTAGVVKSAAAFINAAKDNPRSQNIQPGTYKLRTQMAATDALAMLLEPKNRVINGVTIPEGRTAKDIYLLLEKATRIPVADFEAAAKDPVALGVADSWFQREDDKEVAKTVEGFLFPDTYEIDPKAGAADILKQMVARFNAVAEEVRFTESVRANAGVSAFEGLIVASLAQAEAGVPEDLASVSRVAYNRAYKEKIALQFDVTANYWLQLQGKDGKHSGKLLQSELDDPKNPYNTESKLGLPVGPINNPGKAALEGAANPPKKPWLFFVAVDKTGRSAFATTDAEHQKNVQLACRNGIPLC